MQRSGVLSVSLYADKQSGLVRQRGDSYSSGQLT
jgi:hypothetical protein